MSATLYDERNDILYIPMAGETWRALRQGWSEPVQATIERDDLVFRPLERVGDLYCAPAEEDSVPMFRDQFSADSQEEQCPRGGTHARIAHPNGRCIKCGGSPADRQEGKYGDWRDDPGNYGE